jgi:hypothetical protein
MRRITPIVPNSMPAISTAVGRARRCDIAGEPK